MPELASDTRGHREPSGGAPILELRGIVKSFPGVRALDGADFDLMPGECHAIVGENGAGKSTLMNIVGGVLQPDAGAIHWNHKPVRLANPRAAAKLGIGVVFQELSLAPGMSIAENIFANRQPLIGFGMIDQRKLRDDTSKLLRQFELSIDPSTPVRRLSAAHRQLIEILKALSNAPRVVILDEPTSSLADAERRILFDTIRRLKSEHVAFIYISHHLPEIFEIADRVTVLRDGRKVETFAIADVDEQTLVRRMVGRELDNLHGRRSEPVGKKYFEVRRASRRNTFDNISFDLHRGEILGLAGLVGAGRTELARAICGLERLDYGEMRLNGAQLAFASHAQAVAGGIGYITEDRKEQGLYLRMTIAANCAAPSLQRFARAGWLNDGAIMQSAEDHRRRFNIVSRSPMQIAGTLSGGNQQKVLLSMWMGIDPKVLIVDEPTRGVDIGARSEIYTLLRRLAATGVGILMISSDLVEILGMSDRVMVMRQGAIVAEFSAAEATEENIIAAASGVDLAIGNSAEGRGRP